MNEGKEHMQLPILIDIESETLWLTSSTNTMQHPPLAVSRSETVSGIDYYFVPVTFTCSIVLLQYFLLTDLFIYLFCKAFCQALHVRDCLYTNDLSYLQVYFFTVWRVLWPSRYRQDSREATVALTVTALQLQRLSLGHLTFHCCLDHSHVAKSLHSCWMGNGKELWVRGWQHLLRNLGGDERNSVILKKERTLVIFCRMLHVEAKASPYKDRALAIVTGQSVEPRHCGVWGKWECHAAKQFWEDMSQWLPLPLTDRYQGAFPAGCLDTDQSSDLVIFIFISVWPLINWAPKVLYLLIWCLDLRGDFHLLFIILWATLVGRHSAHC